MKLFVFKSKTKKTIAYVNNRYNWRNNFLWKARITKGCKVVVSDELIIEETLLYCRDKETFYKVSCNPDTTYFIFEANYSDKNCDFLLRRGFKAINYPIVKGIIRDKILLNTILDDKGIDIPTYSLNSPLEYPFIVRNLNTPNIRFLVNNEKEYTESLNENYDIICTEHSAKNLYVDYQVLTMFSEPLITFMRIYTEEKFPKNQYKESIWIPLSHLELLEKEFKKPVFSNMFYSLDNEIDEWKKLTSEEMNLCKDVLTDELGKDIDYDKDIKDIEDLAHQASEAVMLGLGTVNIVKDDKGNFLVTDVIADVHDIYQSMFGKDFGILLYDELAKRGFFNE